MQSENSNRKTQRFWDRIAPKYARKPIADPAAYEAKLARLGTLLRATDRILEIGCGTGSTALRLAPGVAQVTGTDISGGMIGIARSKLRAATSANVRFQQASAADRIEGTPFDAICAFSLLHLVEDVPQVLASVRRQLKPGGLFVSKTVCLKNGSFLIRALVAVLTAIGIAPRVIALSDDDVIAHLRGAGFEVEETEYFGTNRMNPFIIARRAAG